MILLIDNYDSFTYILADYFRQLNQPVKVFKNNALTLTEIESINPTFIVISPGPNGPADAGISLDTILHGYTKYPMLGICLGHQCLAAAFGANIIQTSYPVHGKTSTIIHHKRKLFHHLPYGLEVMRYHSLAVDIQSLPESFSIDAWADDHTIMAISHRQYPLFGLQFHPESILTEHGLTLLSNFLNYHEIIKHF